MTCLSIIFIFATTLGIGMNNIRLVEERKCNGTNRDYLCIMAIGSIFLTFIAYFSKRYGFDPQVALPWFAILLILNMIRVYGEVDFRINLNFSLYFLYYFIVSLGYVVGTLLYKFTANWTHIFLVGEALAIVMLVLRKMIFAPSLPSKKLPYISKAILLLFLSTIMIQLVVSGDRLILKYFLGDRSVTVYSSLSLVAKTGNMVIFPLGALLLSYLAAKTIPTTKKWFFRVVASWLGVCFSAFIGSLIMAPIYVKLFYPDLFNDTVGLSIIVNAGLVLAMVGYLFRLYLIAFTNAIIVFAFELLFTIIHLIFAIYLTKFYGMVGYAWAVIIGRGLRMVTGVVLSFVYINKEEKKNIQTGCENGR